MSFLNLLKNHPLPISTIDLFRISDWISEKWSKCLFYVKTLVIIKSAFASKSSSGNLKSFPPQILTYQTLIRISQLNFRNSILNPSRPILWPNIVNTLKAFEFASLNFNFNFHSHSNNAASNPNITNEKEKLETVSQASSNHESENRHATKGTFSKPPNANVASTVSTSSRQLNNFKKRLLDRKKPTAADYSSLNKRPKKSTIYDDNNNLILTDDTNVLDNRFAKSTKSHAKYKRLSVSSRSTSKTSNVSKSMRMSTEGDLSKKLPSPFQHRPCPFV